MTFMVEIYKHLLVFNSFTKWGSFIQKYKWNLKKFFNFYVIFYLFNMFSKVMIQSFMKFKKKLVILKSPFHYKLFKHHLIYSFYTISCWFFFLSKHLNFFLIKMKLLVFFNKMKKSSLFETKKFYLNQLYE